MGALVRTLKPLLSHTSTMAIQHLIYSCRLVELRLENILLKAQQDWSLNLEGIHYSSLRSLSLQGSNVLDFQRLKAMIGRQLLRLSGSLRRVPSWRKLIKT
ncbi:hypothetical protein CPC16_001020 [Podila verticillata]|nr:hypothetical protein CPC16_001020 [Podila verticillata]KFH66145.1 hypothetical protein MVEG_08246 [Podila verticillata NRRL 6337]